MDAKRIAELREIVALYGLPPNTDTLADYLLEALDALEAAQKEATELRGDVNAALADYTAERARVLGLKEMLEWFLLNCADDHKSQHFSGCMHCRAKAALRETGGEG